MNQNQARILIGGIVLMIVIGGLFLFNKEISSIFQARNESTNVNKEESEPPDLKDKMIALDSDGKLFARIEAKSEIPELIIEIPDRIKLLGTFQEWGIFGYSWVLKDNVYIRENGNSNKNKPVETVRITLQDERELNNENNSNITSPLKSVSLAVNDGVISLNIFIDKSNIEALHPSVQQSVLRSIYFLSQSREEGTKTAQEISADYIKVSHDLDLNNAIYLKVIEK